MGEREGGEAGRKGGGEEGGEEGGEGGRRGRGRGRGGEGVKVKITYEIEIINCERNVRDGWSKNAYVCGRKQGKLVRASSRNAGIILK